LSEIKAIFFDVGATLLAPATDEGVTFTRLARELGITIDPAEVIAKVPLMYGLYEQLYEQDDSFWDDENRARAIWIEMYEYMASMLGIPPQLRRGLADTVYQYYFSSEAWKLFDDVLPTLEMLRQSGLRLGIISNWDQTLTEIIEGLDIAPYFETIISSADVRLHKPLPEIFQLALDNLDVGASEAMHVGDHLYADAAGAARMGMTPVLLDRSNQHLSYEGLRVTSLLQIEAFL